MCKNLQSQSGSTTAFVPYVSVRVTPRYKHVMPNASCLLCCVGAAELLQQHQTAVAVLDICMSVDLPRQLSFHKSCRPLLAAHQAPAGHFGTLAHAELAKLSMCKALQARSVKTSMYADVSFKCLHKGNTGKADALQSWHMQVSLHVQVWLSHLQVLIVQGKTDARLTLW